MIPICRQSSWQLKACKMRQVNMVTSISVSPTTVVNQEVVVGVEPDKALLC
jgi:hypothetical protein